jgi:hypothetical protein
LGFAAVFEGFVFVVAFRAFQAVREKTKASGKPSNPAKIPPP